MISFKNYKDVDSKHGWRNCGVGGCKKQIYGFGRLRRILDNFEGTRIGMRKLRKAYYYDEERAWYGRGPDYDMKTQFLISCIGMNLDDAYSKLKKLVKKHKSIFTYNYRYSVKGWFNEELVYDDSPGFYIDPDGIIRFRVSNYNIYRCFKPKKVSKKYIEENQRNAKNIKLKSGIIYIGNFWVILLDSNTLYPEKVPVYAVNMDKYRYFEEKKKFKSINEFLQQIYVVGFGTENYEVSRWGNLITKAIYVTKKSCLKKSVIK